MSEQQPPKYEDFAVALQMWAEGEPVTVELKRFELWCALSALQLALRHPQFPANLVAPTHAAAEALQKQLPEGALSDVADAGWNPEYDK